jgi:splicing factor 1
LVFLSKLKVLSEAQTIITNTIICTTCGGAGHIASDCKMKNAPEKPVTWQEREKMDSEVCRLASIIILNEV